MLKINSHKEFLVKTLQVMSFISNHKISYLTIPLIWQHLQEI